MLDKQIGHQRLKQLSKFKCSQQSCLVVWFENNPLTQNRPSIENVSW